MSHGTFVAKGGNPSFFSVVYIKAIRKMEHLTECRFLIDDHTSSHWQALAMLHIVRSLRRRVDWPGLYSDDVHYSGERLRDSRKGLLPSTCSLKACYA